MRISDWSSDVCSSDLLHPRSRGRITLTGGRATDKPRIEANYLGDPEGFDLTVMVECARISLDIFAQKAFDDYRGAPIFPARLPRKDATLVEVVRAKAATSYPPVGTFTRGSCDAASVDPHLPVRCIEGLRVDAASVLPTLRPHKSNLP